MDLKRTSKLVPSLKKGFKKKKTKKRFWEVGGKLLLVFLH